MVTKVTKGQWWGTGAAATSSGGVCGTRCYRVVAVTSSLYSNPLEYYSYYFAANQQLPAAGHTPLGVEDHRSTHLANGHMVAKGGAYSVGWRTIERTLFLWFVRVE